MEKRNERPNVGGVSIRSRNDAPSGKGCVVNVEVTKASNKLPPPPPSDVFFLSTSTPSAPYFSYFVKS